MCLGGAWIVLLELRQAGTPEPLTGTWQFGHGEAAAQAAHSAAYRFRRGHRVSIYYASLGLGRTRYDEPAVELRGVTSVQAAPLTGSPSAAEQTAAHLAVAPSP